MTRSVVRVIDAETVLLDDGQEVRLLGALAPKPTLAVGSASEWSPESEARRHLAQLVDGRSVTLSHEGLKRDRYGRILAQLSTSEHGWVQQRMIEAGHARAYALPGNSGCIAALVEAERTARDGGRGLWSRDVYRVRVADETDELLRLASQFVLVTGQVANVTLTKRVAYINFGNDWKRDFTATLSGSILDKIADGRQRVSALKGRHVRVRGWIERRNGPMIVLNSLDEIETLVDDAAQTKTPR